MLLTLLQCLEFIWKNVARFQTEKLSLFARLFGKESKRKQKKDGEEKKKKIKTKGEKRSNILSARKKIQRRENRYNAIDEETLAQIEKTETEIERNTKRKKS